MSAISLKSITGITSITTPAGVDNQLTLHNNNTTEAVKLDIAGNLHINNQLAVAGVSTLGSGASGQVRLDYQGNQKLKTHTWGVEVSGALSANNIVATAANSSFAGASFTGDITCTSDLTLDSTNTDYPRITLHSNATGIRKYAIINGQGWNQDALLIYDIDADNTRLTIEPNGLGINRGANSISHGLDVGGSAIIRGNTETTGDITISSVAPTINLTETNGDPDYRIFCNGGIFNIVDVNNNVNRIEINSNRTTINNPTLINDNILYVLDTITHWGDDNTKIRFPSDDTISFETAGSERLRITSSGQIGIGTATVRNNRIVQITGASQSNLLITGHVPSVCLNSDPDDSSDGDRSFFGQAAGSNHFANGTASGDTILRGTSSGKIIFAISTSVKMHLTSAGDLNIGTVGRFDASGIVKTAHGSESAPSHTFLNDPDNGMYRPTTNTLGFVTGGGEKLRIANDGKIFVANEAGTIDTTARLGEGNRFQLAGLSSNDGISVVRYNSSYGAWGLNLGRSKSNTLGTNVALQDNDDIGHVTFWGADGSDFNMAAQITAEVDGTPSNGTDMPGSLVFKTSAEASGTPTERLRISSDGNLVQSSTTAFQIAKGTTAQRPSSPAQGMLRLNTSNKTLELYGTGNTWVIVSTAESLGTSSNPAKSGKQLYNAGYASGDYYIKPEGYSGSAIECYVDMTTNGGGWVLVASYVAQGGFEQSSSTNGSNESTVKDYATTRPSSGVRLLNKNFINYLAHQNTTNGSNSDYSIMGVHGRSGTGYVHWEVKANSSNRTSSFDFFKVMYRTQDANNNMDVKIRQETSTNSTTDYVGKTISGNYSNYNSGRAGTADGNGSYHYLIDDYYGGYEWAFRENIDDIPSQSGFNLSVMFIR